MPKPHEKLGQAPSGKQVNPQAKERLRILNSERAHFSFGSNDRETLLGKLRPVIRTYAQNGIRKPKDVSQQLNNAGHRTACGEKWTPRLTWFLLAMIFEKKDRPATGIWEQSLVRPQPQPQAHRKKTSITLPGLRSLGALPNPLFQKSTSLKRLKRKARIVETAKRKEPQPAPPLRLTAEAALRVIPKLPDMGPEGIIAVWRNSLAILVDPEKAHLQQAARRILDAISAEWERRRLNPINADDYFKWPSTEADGGDGGLMAQQWPATGLLKFMGYVVGRTDGEPREVREAILAEIFSGQLPLIVSAAYMNEWGSPKSAQRLRKMAETIAALTRNAKRRRDSVMDDAIRDWESDLQMLYERYYIGHFHFAWPATAL